MEWIAELRADWLTPIMKGFTFLGDEEFFLAALPLGYWLWRRTAFARVAVVLFATVVLNAALKEIWQSPRPPEPHLVHADGWSFPSGHAQLAAAFWGWLAIEARKGWFTALALCLIAGIAFSRPYLGVHYPHDVLVGVLVGGATVALGYAAWRKGLGAWLAERSPLLAWAVVAAPIVGVALALSDPEDTALKSAATITGLWAVSLWLDRLDVGPLAPRWGARIGALVLGFAVLLGLWAGGKQLLVALDAINSATSFLRYLLVGIWAGVAPLVFQRLGWAGEPRPEVGAS